MAKAPRKGVVFNKPPNFAARDPNFGRGTAPQLTGVYKGSAPTSTRSGPRGQGTVPKASAGNQPLVAPKTGKGKALVGRALRRTPVAF